MDAGEWRKEKKKWDQWEKRKKEMTEALMAPTREKERRVQWERWECSYTIRYNEHMLELYNRLES